LLAVAWRVGFGAELLTRLIRDGAELRPKMPAKPLI